MNKNLKPCPMCGSTDIRESRGDGHGAFWTMCEDCGVSTSDGDAENQEEANARWNLRAQIESPLGWKIVPIEPTAEMLDAGKTAHGIYHTGNPGEIYAAMIAAAHQPKEQT